MVLTGSKWSVSMSLLSSASIDERISRYLVGKDKSQRPSNATRKRIVVSMSRAGIQDHKSFIKMMRKKTPTMPQHGMVRTKHTLVSNCSIASDWC